MSVSRTRTPTCFRPLGSSCATPVWVSLVDFWFCLWRTDGVQPWPLGLAQDPVFQKQEQKPTRKTQTGISHDDPRGPKHVGVRVLEILNTNQRKGSKRGKTKWNVGGRVEKARNFRPPSLGAPPFWDPPFRAPTLFGFVLPASGLPLFWGPPCLAHTFSGLGHSPSSPLPSDLSAFGAPRNGASSPAGSPALRLSIWFLRDSVQHRIQHGKPLSSNPLANAICCAGGHEVTLPTVVADTIPDWWPANGE